MNGKAWTDIDLKILRKYYADTPSSVLAVALKRKVEHVYAKANSLGLQKSEAFLAGPYSGRTDGSIGESGRFNVGLVPWNKGKHHVAGGRSAETRFKAGGLPHNTVPVGSYRLDSYGILQRKIREAPGSNSQRWRGVHELVWIEANGPVPPKHIVRFKPGQRTAVLEEITLDRVECVSLADHLRRNSLHRYPKEIVHAIQVRAALNRRINREQQNNQ